MLLLPQFQRFNLQLYRPCSRLLCLLRHQHRIPLSFQQVDQLSPVKPITRLHLQALLFPQFPQLLSPARNQLVVRHTTLQHSHLHSLAVTLPEIPPRSQVDSLVACPLYTLLLDQAMFQPHNLAPILLVFRHRIRRPFHLGNPRRCPRVNRQVNQLGSQPVHQVSQLLNQLLDPVDCLHLCRVLCQRLVQRLSPPILVTRTIQLVYPVPLQPHNHPECRILS